jgi:hypothetical protein
VSHVRLPVYWSVSSAGHGAGNIEDTALSVVASWTVYTELLAGNALIKSIILLPP